MKRVITANVGFMIAVGVFVLAVPLYSHVQLSQALEGVPPVGQTLVREGTFAIELAKAFEMPGDANEVESESWLADAGVSPLNGWIADYPVTPDIIGELRKAVGDAVETAKINLDKDEALNRFDRSLAAVGLDLKPLNDGQYARVAEFNNDIVPAADVVKYYTVDGPPVVTYYAPPPNYYGMYAWISYPFWCNGYWYGGYFILNDFHRPVFIGRDHHRGFVSNHIRDRGHGNFSRIEPQTRAALITATGIGMSGSRLSAPREIRQSIRSELNLLRENAPPAIRSTAVNAISIRPATPHQSGGSESFRTVTTQVRAPEMPEHSYSAPHNSSAEMGMTGFTPQGNYSRSLHNGFFGGSPSHERTAGFSAGHVRR